MIPPPRHRITRAVDRDWRRATARLRRWPDFVIIGGMRCGTTSLYLWLCSHPGVTPSARDEIKYFDTRYRRGPQWYRSQFPLRRPGRITGESSPYMLLHPLSPTRAVSDLPESTRFIAMLRDPVERAISHYWYERRLQREPEDMVSALRLEPERLAPYGARLARGEAPPEHRWWSYLTRGEYAPQLRRWFDVAGRHRVLVLDSQTVFADPDAAAQVTDWLGLPPNTQAFLHLNAVERREEAPAEAVDLLERHFAPYNEDLFDLLGTRLWGR